MTPVRNKQGFTLIELMIVVVIIGILAAVALPKFTGMSKAAKESEADPILKEVYTLQQAYYTRFNRFADTDELATHGFDINLSSIGQANTQGRFYYIDIVGQGGNGTTATYCAVARLTTKGTDNSLQIKSMGEGRIITPGVETCAS